MQKYQHRLKLVGHEQFRVQLLCQLCSPAVEPIKRLICNHCGAKISYPEGKFCWNNANRFGGLAYCREHQPLFQAS